MVSVLATMVFFNTWLFDPSLSSEGRGQGSRTALPRARRDDDHHVVDRLVTGRLAAALLAIILVALGGIALTIGPSAAIGAADAWLRTVGGSADTTTYQVVASAYVNAYLIAGGVLLLAGLLLVAAVAVRSTEREGVR